MKRRCLLYGGAMVMSGVAGCGSQRDGGTQSPRQDGTSATVTNNEADAQSSSTPAGDVKIVPRDGDGQDSFGFSVAIEDSTALVGAIRDEDPNGQRAGSAYVFERTSSGWTQQAKLAPDDGASGDTFGVSLDLSGDTILIGASGADSSNTEDVGAAYVFERASGEWTQQAKLVPEGSDTIRHVGIKLSLSGNTALLGVPADEDPSQKDAGMVYVFERANGEWTQQTKLVPDDVSAGDAFGGSVAVVGDLALIGASGDDATNGDLAGSAYVFERADGGWTQQAKLVPEDGDADDMFGWSVGLAEGVAIVGTFREEDPNGEFSGSAYVFERANGEWTQQTKLVPEDGDAGDRFGNSVALTNDFALVGAYADEDPNGEDAGSVYLFERTDGGWTQQAKLLPEDGDSSDFFGRGLAIFETTVLIGAYGDEDPNGNYSGSAYVFEV